MQNLETTENIFAIWKLEMYNQERTFLCHLLSSFLSLYLPNFLVQANWESIALLLEQQPHSK